MNSDMIFYFQNNYTYFFRNLLKQTTGAKF